MNEAQIRHAERMRSAGVSNRRIATTLGVNESTVRRALGPVKPKPKVRRRVTVIVIEEEV